MRFGFWGGQFCRFLNLANKTDAFARIGSDEALLSAGIAHRLACGIDAARQCRVGHDPAVPDGGEEVILGENAITIFHEIGDQVEHLGLERHLLGTAPELAAFGVKPMTFKEKLRQEDPFQGRVLERF